MLMAAPTTFRIPASATDGGWEVKAWPSGEQQLLLGMLLIGEGTEDIAVFHFVELLYESLKFGQGAARLSGFVQTVPFNKKDGVITFAHHVLEAFAGQGAVSEKMNKDDYPVNAMFFRHFLQIVGPVVQVIDRLDDPTRETFEGLVQIDFRPVEMVHFFGNDGALEIILQVAEQVRVGVIPEIGPKNTVLFAIAVFAVWLAGQATGPSREFLIIRPGKIGKLLTAPTR